MAKPKLEPTAASRQSEAQPETAFYIPARAPISRPRRTLKHNDAFAVLDCHGDIGASSGGSDGLFYLDMRVLSHLELLLNGAQPLLLGSNLSQDNLSLYVDLTNPDIYANDEIVLLKDTIHISRAIYVRDSVLRERIAVVNHSENAVALTLSITFDSDFADLFEVRGMRRPRRGAISRSVRGVGDVVLSYNGLDRVVRETALCFEPAPTALRTGAASYALKLEPRQTRRLFISVSARGTQRPTLTFFRGLVGARRELKSQTQNTAHVETSNAVLNEILSRSKSDLYMLMTATPQGPYPYAGTPWYSTTFGRDGLITAMQMLWFDPRVAVGVLRRLSHYQADKVDPEADAQPGKILHEMRGGEMAALGEIPFGLYYGSVDSTPLFVVLAGLYLLRTGDEALVRDLWPSIERALQWIDNWGDLDGDGFYEYARASEKGLSNQGWKDSHDSVFHADGQLAEGPIALVEVQGYVYLAKQLAAECARRLGLHERAAKLDKEAEALRGRFEDAFWCEDMGLYALALDGAKRPCRVRTSNAGHTLFTGIMRPDRARQTARAMLQPDFFSGWGIRTVASGEARYNPMSYHNGSVWPHDNAMIAQGFARLGLMNEIEPVFRGLMDAATFMDHRRLPELFCGFRRRPARGPTLYPVACAPQAWAAGAPFQLLKSMLGLQFDPARRRIELCNPRVPSSIGEITVRNLRLGRASADFTVRQESRDAVSLQVLRATGQLEVSLVFNSDGGTL
jgi:glycogen debranching enzyme